MFKSIYKILHKHYHIKYHGTYKQAKKLFIFDLALLGLAFLMFGASIFFFFWKPGITDLIDLSASIGTERIKSGEEITIYIKYGNRSKFNLNNVSLALRTPEGFILDEKKTPDNILSKNGLFNLQNLKPGEKGEFQIHGRLWTNIGTEEKIQAIISYNPENKKRREQKLSVMIINLPESVLTSKLTIPETSYPGNNLPFTLTLKNSGKNTLKNLKIRHSWSNKIVFNENIENLEIKPNEEKEIAGTIITPNKSGNQDWVVFIDILKNNKSFLQTTSKKSIKIFIPKIYTKATIKNKPLYAEPKMTLPLEIYHKNNSKFNIKNLKIKISFTDGIVDLKKTAKENNLKIEGNSLIADGTTRTSLSNSQVGKEDYFTINLKLLNKFSIKDLENQSLIITPSAITTLPNEKNQQKIELKGESASIHLATELSMIPEIRYYTKEGDQLGRGSLPPKVGEGTKYWVFIKIFNTTNNVRNVKFSTSLPENVIFTGKQSVTIGPSLNYNKKNKTITWNYKELPANSQTGLYFEISTIPNSSQIGKNVDLVNKLYFSAKDNFTGKEFNLFHSGLNNKLNKNDKGSKFGSKVSY